MDGELLGYFAAFFGIVVGCVGTGYGVHASIQNADTPERKEFIRKVGFYGVAALFVFLFAVVLSGVGMLPNWVVQLAVIAWFALMGPVIFLVNRSYAKMGKTETA